MRVAHILLASVVTFAFVPSGRGDEPKAAPSTDAKTDRERQLEKKIESLEKENAKLRKQIETLREGRLKLEASPGHILPRSGSGPLAPLVPQSVPNGWVAKEFNGQTFYIVPLTGSK